MSATPVSTTASASSPSEIIRALPNRRRRREFVSACISTVTWLTFGIVAVVLSVVIVYVVAKGYRVVNWQFLTTSPIQIREDQSDTVIGFGQVLRFGMWPAIVGTVLITGAAAAMALPIGILGGVYLNEIGRDSRLARAVRFLSDVMTGVPSVVMGLFIFTVLVLRTRERTGLAGALALACLMLPIVIRSTEEMLALVPEDLREASTALGARTATTTWRVVLPTALPGIVSGALLAIVRAAGETAPLLFTIGVISATNYNLFRGQNTALSAQIFSNAQSPYPEAVARGWGAALVLITITLMFTVLARGGTWWYRRRRYAFEVE
ncbi:MAG: phosphate ABC transporter permease PstA [Acidimicrobiia bacterium]